jgi:hypothetical protein
MGYCVQAGLGRLGADWLVDSNPFDGIKIVIVGREGGHHEFFHHGKRERIIGQQTFFGMTGPRRGPRDRA